MDGGACSVLRALTSSYQTVSEQTTGNGLLTVAPAVEGVAMADLSAFFRHAAANDNALKLRTALVWMQRVPSAERRGGLPVAVIVGRDLVVQVVEMFTGVELAFGDLHDGGVEWQRIDDDRLCITAEEMIVTRVREALRIFARGIASPMWVHAKCRRELRHVAA